MGELLSFPLERTRREPASAPPAFFFDLCSPECYLVAERVERLLGEVDWVAVDGTALPHGRPTEHAADVTELMSRSHTRERARVEALAHSLRLPLVWPDVYPFRAPRALRAATFACELGAGPAFVLAASRLAFCGGFGLEDPETIAEAAAAASVPLGPCLEAAADRERDAELAEAGEALAAAGLRSLPAFRIEGRWLEGESGFAAAAASVAEVGASAMRLARRT